MQSAHVFRRISFFTLIILFFAMPVVPAFALDYSIGTVETQDDVTVMEITGEMDATVVGSSYSEPMQAIANEFYATHSDTYDFLVVFSGFDFEMPDTDRALGFYHPVRNDVQGIGTAGHDDDDGLFDNSFAYGSDSRLQGVIVMGPLMDMVTDPLDPDFTTTMNTLSHEILHRWAAFVDFEDSDGSISRGLIGNADAHWSFLLDTDGSVMYGNEWQDNGNGTFTAFPGRKYYSPLDLYLMGLIDKSEVPPMTLIENTDVDPTRLPATGEVVEGTVKTVTIDDIIAAEGERIPSAEDSQKQFRVATIVITRPGMHDNAQVVHTRNIMTNWVMWFSALTDGKAAVVPDTAYSPELAENPGIDDPTYDPRQAPPEIADGVAWLVDNQNVDGSWQDTSLTIERDTASALIALVPFTDIQSTRSAGLDWLAGIIPENSDYMAKVNEAMARHGDAPQALTDELLMLQNADGGWGAGSGYGSNALDTACAVSALVAAGMPQSTNVDSAIAYLVATQDTDGGWKCEEYEDDTGTTACVLSALAVCGKDSSEGIIQDGLAWLYNHQNTDGGFGNSPSTVYDTALALIALQRLNGDTSVAGDALGFILDHQAADGSWYESPYQTALAVNAVWEAMHEPDLAVETGDITFAPASVTTLPSSITVQVEVANKGLTDVAETMVALYEGVLAEANKIGEQTIALAGTTSTTLTFDVEVTEGRAHRFYVGIDGGKQIAESCETNNTALALLYPDTTYDFEITGISLSPDTADVLTPIAVTAEVRNNGASDAFNVPVRYFVNGEEIGTVTIDTIPAGSSVTRDYVWEADTTGDLSLSVTIDPDDIFPNELSEANNTGTAALTINPLTQPNLAVDHLNISIAPNPPFEGGDAAITTLVENNGFADIADVFVTVYNGIPGQGGSVIDNASIDSLASGESRSVELTWQNIPVSGEQIIYVEADASDPVTEIKDTDNSAFVSVDILSLPDLEISSGNIVVDPSISKEGDMITITATVINSGGQSVVDVPVDLIENSTVIDGIAIAEVPGMSSAAASFTYDTTGRMGAHEVTIQIDPDNTVIEQDEANNTATGRFGVQDADLWLTERYISPNGDGVQDNTRFFFNLPAPQTVQVTVADDGNNVIRRFVDERFDNTMGGEITWDGLDASSMVAGDGDYAIQVRDQNGTLIAALPVTVDNNRSPLMDAIGTEYFYNKNITCMLPEISEDWQWFSDESGILFYIPNTDDDAPEYPRGLYTMTPDGESINRLVPSHWREADSDQDYGYSYYDYALSPDEQQVAIILDKLQDWEYVETQIWTVGRYGEDLFNVVSCDYEQEDDGAMVRRTIKSIKFAPDSSNIAYMLNVYHEITGSHEELHVVQPDGTGHQKIAETPPGGTITAYVWAPDGSAVVYVSHDSEDDPDRIIKAGQDGSTDTLFYAEAGDVVDMQWLDAQKLVVETFAAAAETYYVRLVDAADPGPAIQVADDIRKTYYYGGDYSMNFTPTIVTLDNTAGFVFIDNSSDIWEVKQCDTEGNLTVLHESVFVNAGFDYNPYVSLNDLRLSPDGNTLVFVDYAYQALSDGGQPDGDDCYYDAHLVSINLVDGNTSVHRLDNRNACAEAYSYHIHTMEDDAWVEQGELHFTGDLRTKYFELNAVDTTSPFKMKIVQTGLDEAFINEVKIRIDGTSYLPSSAINMETGEDVLPLLVSEDESVDAYDASIELVWNNLPAGIQYPELVMTATEFGYFYEDGSLRWFGNDTLVGVEKNAGDYTNRIFGVNLEQMEEAPLTAWTEDEIRFKVSPLYNAIACEKPVDYDSICAGRGYTDTWIMKSLLNLTASLSAVKTDTAIQLIGTAMDGNFDYYALEYSPVDDTTEWTPVRPVSDIPVVDEILANWVPPAEGSYYVRLAVTDKAGNTTIRRIRVFWGERTSITGLYKTGVTFTAQGDEFTGTGDIFSPSTDSTKDGVAIHYKVMAPAHLEFKVADGMGMPVRTFEKDYAALPPGGTEDHIIWDGRDESGELVADGEYAITVFNYEFYTRVDRTPPEGEIALSDLEWKEQTDGAGNILYANLAARLNWQAVDKNLKDWVVTYGEGANPDQWVEFRSGSQVDEYYGEKVFIGKNIELVVEKTFRLTATDEAGNIRTITMDKMLEEQLVLYFFTKEDGRGLYGALERKQDQFFVKGVVSESYLDSILWLKPLETIRLPLSEAMLQYCGYDGVWHDKTVLENPDAGMFDIEWSPDSVDLSTVQALRIKALDETQAVHYSNELPFRPALCINSGQCPLISYRYNQGVREALSRIEFQVSPEDLDEWATYHVYDGAAGDPIENGHDIPMPLPEDYDPETKYQLRIVGTGASGEEYVSSKENFPMVCEDGSFFSTDIEYPSTLDCGFVGNNTVITPYYQLSGTSGRDSENYYPPSDFKSISYTIKGDSGPIIIVETTDSTETEFIVSTAGLVEGVYQLTGVLEYGDQVKTATVDFYVDRKPPTVGIAAPATGVRLCPRQIGDDEVQYGIDIEGSIIDNNPLPYGEAKDDTPWNYKLFYRMEGSPIWQLATRIGKTPFEFEGMTTGHLGTWDVTDLDAGSYSLRLLAVDHTGNVTCDTVSDVYIDTGINLIVDGDSIFSPDGDGEQDEMTIYYTLDEYAAVDATVLHGDTMMALLMGGQTMSPGSHSIVWDGAGASDGEYTITLTARDGCGNSTTRSITTIVDNTPPEAEIIYPQTGDALGIVVEVLGSATDTHFSSFSLNAFDQADPGNPVVLSNGASPVNENILARWNTIECSGTWTLALTAADKAGNTAETSVSVDLGDRQSLITNLEAEPRLFSPNSDGISDETAIHYELSPDIGENYSVAVTIAQSGGGTVKVLQDTDVAPGVHNIAWNGETDDGTPVIAPDSEYAVTLSVSPASAPSLIHEETITVVVDTTAPVLDFSAPVDDSYYQAAVPVEGNITDDHLTSYQIECTDDTAVIFSVEGNQNRENHRFTMLEQLAEGTHTLAVAAEDGAGNTSQAVISFAVDKTPPQPEFLSPAAGALFGGVETTVAVDGTVEEENLAAWRLRFGIGEDPPQWHELASGDTFPVDDHLFDWSVGPASSIDDGVYTLSLLAEDKAGWQNETTRRIVVDSTPPTVAIATPPADGYMTASFVLEGTARDENFSSYTVSLSNNPCDGDPAWGDVSHSEVAVDDGVLASLAHLPSDGSYCLGLFAEDMAGNSAEQVIDITVDTQPPAAPALSGTPGTQTAVNLSWTPVDDADLAGYNLYRNGQQIAALLSETIYTDTGLDEGTYTYVVRAADHAGWESEPSNEVSFDADLTGPNVKLAIPGDGSTINDLVEIKGTAYSSDDFKEYRVYLGVGQSPAEWTLLRTSPLSVSYGVLASLADPLSSAGEYAVKLEAEDINGNVSTCQSVFTLDDQPPTAPVLLSAQATAADVALTWEPNTEVDLAGYLVYRNGDLVNADGPVVGDLTPYLIDALAYTDIDLVDGDYTYHLAAMDQAGNISAPSNAIAVTVDTREPQAVITSPENGHLFESPIKIKAVCEDQDVEEIQFQYSIAGESTWVDSGQPFTNGPYVLDFDPAAFGLAYGNYDIRAVAVDRHGRQDSAPQSIVITYADLTPPAEPEGFQAVVNGGEIDFTWDANSEADLAGYTVYNIVGDYYEPLNATPVAETSFHLSDGFDGTYLFCVKALDNHDNESGPSATISAIIYTPGLNQPDSPVSTADINISGNNAGSGSAVAILVNDEPVADVTADAAGGFSGALTLAEGTNMITARATDTAGNTSKVSDPVTVVYSAVPAIPSGLTASVDGYDCTVSWTPNPESDIAGYHVYRDGTELTANPVSGTTYTDIDLADGIYNYAVSAEDIYGFESAPSTPVAANVGDVEAPQPPQGLTGIADESTVILSWDPNSEPDLAGYRAYRYSGDEWIQLPAGLIPETTATDADLKNGVYDYRVTAVDETGNESGPATVTVTVAVTIPDAPEITTVRSHPQGRMIKICWEEMSDDGAAYLYHAYRSQTPGGPYTRITDAPLDETCYLDEGVENDIDYYYTVTAVDGAGNEGNYSNEVSARAEDIIPLPRPEIVAPTIPGSPITVSEWNVDVAGLAESGSIVDLYSNGGYVDSVIAASSVFSRDYLLGDSNINVLAVSPDDTRVAYCHGDGGMLLLAAGPDADAGLPGATLVVRDIDSGTETLRTSVGGDVFRLEWSPDNERIACFVNGQAGQEIDIYETGTGERSPLLGDDSDMYTPAWASWSSDGSALAVVRVENATGISELCLMDAQTGDLTPVVQTPTPAEAIYAAVLSPDDNYIAYLHEADGGMTLKIATVSDGTTVFSTMNFFWGQQNGPKWAPAANRLLYVSVEGYCPALSIFDVDTGSGFQSTNCFYGGMNFPYDWCPDGERFMYFTQSDDIGRVVEMGTVGFPDFTTVLAELDEEPLYLQPASNSGFWLVDWSAPDVLSLTNKGTFAFEEADLSPGENAFQVRSGDDDDPGETAWSDSISVTLDPDALPDLLLSTDDLFVYPPTPVEGETVIGSVSVKNPHPQLAENVIVEIYATDAAGGTEAIATETLEEIAAGGSESVSFFWDTTNRHGNYTITVTADPENVIYEADESNNTAEKQICITGDYGLTMEAALDNDHVTRGNPLQVYVSLVNSGPALDGHLTVRVVDEYDETVEELANQSLSMAYGTVADRTCTFDTAAVIAGDYAVHAVFENQSGSIQETRNAFVIDKHIELSASISPDRQTYGANTPVAVNVRVTNSGISPVDAATCRLVIAGPQGEDLYTETQALSTMLSGSSTSLDFAWNTGLHMPGAYDLNATVMSGDAVMAEAGASIEIAADTSISGTLDVTPGWIVPGNIVTAEYSLTNTGNSPASSVPVDIMMIDPTTGNVIDTILIEPDLGADATVTGSVSFATDTLGLNIYTIRLQITETIDSRTLATGTFTVSDATPPEVTILSPEAGGEYHADFSLSVEAHDRLSLVKTVEYAVDGGAWHSLPPADPSTGLYANRFMPESGDEGPHVFSFRAADKYYNTSEPVDISVDIVPRVDLSATLNAQEYGMNETVVIETVLANIAWEKQVILSAAIETGAGDPVHEFDETVMTLPDDSSQTVNLTWNTADTPAGNYRARLWIVKDGAVLNEVMVPFVIQPSINIEGAIAAADSVPLGDPLQVQYTVQNNGNVAMTDLDMTLALIDPADAQTVMSHEVSADIDISAAVTGETSFDTAGLEAITYQLVLSAMIDGTATVLAESTAALLDTVPPEVTIVAPEPGQVVDGPMTLAVDAVDSGAGIADVSYRFDSGEWQPMTAAGGDRFVATYDPAGQADGSHTITFRAIDSAGNVSDQPSVDIQIESYVAFNALTGTLAISPEPVLEGTEATFTYMVANNTPLPVGDLTMQIQLIDPESGNAVKTLERTINPSNGFAFDHLLLLMDVAAKTYTVKLTVAMDGPVAPRDLYETSLEVIARPDIDIDKQAGGDAISLLVWLNDNCRLECELQFGGDCNNNAGCEVCEWQGCVREDLLQGVLDEAVLDYHIVTDPEQFEAELRNPYYTDILILGDFQNISFNASAELMEKMNAGTGVVSSLWFEHTFGLNAASSADTDLFGVYMDGASFVDGYIITAEDSPISSQCIIWPEGEARRVAAEGDALAEGWVELETGVESPAIVLHTYGDAQTVYFAFDLGLTLENDYAAAASLLAQAVQYVHGSRNISYPWGMVPVMTEITTTGGDFDHTLTETFDPGLQLYDPVAKTWIADNPWQFDINLDPDEATRLPMFYLLPDAAGTYGTETEIGLTFDSTYVMLENRTFDLPVTADLVTRYNNIIDTLSTEPSNTAYGMMYILIDTRDRTITCRADIEENIGDIINVLCSIYYLNDIDITALRKDLDTLLAIEQGRYYLYE
ncbi:MAG: CARDB domain-containing protein [Thermodesulfobacteriota bacterium]|nr:CARDB domain-containing protein [Thermodesulfobacteriota bacterium]